MFAEVSNTFDWWATTGGVLGVLVFLGIGGIIWGIRSYVAIRSPYWKRKQELDLAKDEKQCRLYDTLTEDAPIKTVLMQQQHALLEKIDERAARHDETCRSGHDIASKSQEILNQIAAKVLP